MTKDELIQGCIRNDQAAQKALYDQYAPRFLSLCMRYAGNRMEAEDIMQEGFVKIFRNLKKLRETAAFEGWMRRIFVNTALKNLSRKEPDISDVTVEDVKRKATNIGPIEDMSEQELLRVISELPQGYRVVFNLYAIEGYKHKEISEMLDIQESTSRTQLLKARKLLQKKLRGLTTAFLAL